MFARLATALLLCVTFAYSAADTYEYKVLATTRTATMEKELNQAAEQGFRIEKAMGGDSAFGGSEVIVVMSREKSSPSKARYAYKLLAANRTSTLQKELNDAGEEGFEYKDQTIFNSAFGGREVVAILELDREMNPKVRYQYKLLATSKTSTMQKELLEAGAEGFKFVGVTVSKTAFGGNEVVSILRKDIP
jgi:hypothetical protein